MTNPEQGDRNFRVCRMSLKRALREVIRMGHVNGSLIYGLHQAALAMESGLQDILLCIIGACGGDDPGIQIHCLLIETVCRENNIAVLKVRNSSHLCEVLGSHNCGSPVNCVLIKNYEGLNHLAMDSINYHLRTSAG